MCQYNGRCVVSHCLEWTLARRDGIVGIDNDDHKPQDATQDGQQQIKFNSILHNRQTAIIDEQIVTNLLIRLKSVPFNAQSVLIYVQTIVDSLMAETKWFGRPFLFSV